MMNKNEQEKVTVYFNIGSNVPVDIPKFINAEDLVDICSKQFQIDTQEYRVNLTRNNIFLTSGDNEQVLEFAKYDVITVSVEAKWI